MTRRPLLNKLLVPTLLASSITAAPSVQAEQMEPRWFEVEVILFTRNVPASSVNEHWPSESQRIVTKDAPDLLAPLLFPPEPEASEQSHCIPADAIVGDDQATNAPIDDTGGVEPGPEAPGSDASGDDVLAEAVAGEEQTTLPPVCDDTAETALTEPQPHKALANVPQVVTAPSMPSEDKAPYLIDESSLQLTKQRQVISQRPEFKLMLHTGWRQEMVPRRGSPRWHLFAGRDFSEQFNPDGTTTLEIEPTPSLLDCPEGTVTFEGECLAADNPDGELQASGADTLGLDSSGMDTPVSDQPEQQAPLSEQQVQDNIVALLEAQEGQGEQPVQPSSDEILSEVTDSPEEPVLPVWELDGLFRVYLEHYLYIDADFSYHIEGERIVPVAENIEGATSLEDDSAVDGEASLLAAPEPTLSADELVTDEFAAETLPFGQQEDPEAGGTLVAQQQMEPYLYSYRLNQTRRLRSGELHYIDHPLMGILIQIRTHEYRAPAPEVSPDEGASSGTQAVPGDGSGVASPEAPTAS
ncbi:CsiV family protein [Corallincola platygyrae]|uniref:CsiV family protein n=1 Tax=Corallincola platygyrae TaxID=1193278 RepID=A0ABW4XMW7_9GAMM